MNYYFAPVLLCLAATAMAQPSQVMEFLPPSVAERGPHHRVIEQVLRYQTLSGQIAERKGTYTEIGTGLQFWNGDRWSDSDISIDVFEGYAAALRGQIKAVFLANINSSGAIELTFEGRRYASHLVALLYTDAMSGQSVVVAQIKDSIGEVQPEGKVLYRDAFGGCKIDVLYTYSLAGVEQDLLIREQLPGPWLFGIDPQFARIEAITEFVDSPEPAISSVVWERNVPPEVRAAMAEPDLVDETLKFGLLEIGPGGAFPQEEGAPAGLFNEVAVPISKRWIVSNQRRFLFEIVDYLAVEPELRRLPQGAAAQKPPGPLQRLAKRELLSEKLRRPPVRQAQDQTLRMASLPAGQSGKGLVWDYSIAINQTNFTFRGDTTYLVRSDVQLSGTTRIEGGAVIKYTNTPAASSRLLFKGPVECSTSPWNPAIFTSMSDCTVGEVISTNAISGSYGTRLMDFSSSGQAFVLHDLKLRYGGKGLVMSAGSSLTVTNFQIVECTSGVEANGSYIVNFFNGLMYSVGNALAINSSPTVRGEHLTFHNLTHFRSSDSSALPNLTNCLIIAGGSRVEFNGSNVETNLSDSGIFQVSGAGAHYLAENSPYLDAGTTNINPSLAAALRGLTTCPPIVLTNDITQDTVLSPQTTRDSNVPDLGYHISPIDFALNGLAVTNATLLLTNGVVIAMYGDSGLWLKDGATLFSQGSPATPNILARHYAIQELGTAWGDDTGFPFMVQPKSTTNAPPTLRLRFTKSFIPSGGGYHTSADVGGNYSYRYEDLEMAHSGVYGGLMTLTDTNTAVYGLTNNLLDRVDLRAAGDAQLSCYNNLIRGGDGFLKQSPTNSAWIFKDNLIDSSELTNLTQTLLRNDNAFFNSSTFYSTYNTNSSELILTSLAYETGPLGSYYQPTNSILINAGSRDSDDAGLFHFTAIISEDKEEDSTVDIGLHYVATDNGVPIDTDDDGLPDYFEDQDGDAVADTGETDWEAADTDGDGVSDYLEWLQGRNPLAGAGADTNQVIQLKVFTPLK